MALIHRNVKLQRAKKISSWRKISMGSWRPIGDSSIHTQIEIDAEPLLQQLEQINKSIVENQARVKFVNYFSKALGVAVANNPQINSIVRFGKVYPRNSVDIFFHVVNNFNDGEDLSGFTIRSIDKKDLTDIASEFYDTSKKIKTGEHKENDRKVKFIFKFIPGFISRMVLDIFGFILYSLNIWSPLMGSPRDYFGSIMLSYIGSFGGDNAFAPIAPYTRIPMVVSLGAIKKRPYVIENAVVVRKTVRVGLVYDHRICDGIQMQKMINDLVEFIENPEIQV